MLCKLPQRVRKKKGKPEDQGENGQSNDKHKTLELFFEEAIHFRKKGEVILQGDINARIGKPPDFVD